MPRAVPTRGTDAITADDLIGLHQPRNLEELRTEMACHLARVLPAADFAVLFEVEPPDLCSVELAAGPSCPFENGQIVRAADWCSDRLRSIPLPYRDQTMGWLLIDGPLDESHLAHFYDLAAHYAVALVNLKLNEEALRTADQYCASLQAFEEGVVLFQEPDPDAVGARLVSLITSVLGSQAGALYLLREIGKPDSQLELAQALGIPETMLAQLCTADGEWWPAQMIEAPLEVIERDGANGALRGLEDSCLPAVMENIVSLPVRHHGMPVGLCVAFNAKTDDRNFPHKLENVGRLGKLGGAVYHRLHLEAESLAGQELRTQLAVAGAIQARLIPKQHPETQALRCAWRSQPAQTVGGDYFDVIGGDDGRVFAVVADVSGHGLNSALLMTSFRAATRAECLNVSPDALFEHLNEEVHHEVGQTGMFITAAGFLFDPDARRATYASAGHNPIMLYRAATGSVDTLDSTGPSLGFFSGMDFDLEEVALDAGDVLLLYTDGIVEATRADGEMFGDDRLSGCLRDNAEGEPDDVLNAVLSAVCEFVSGAPYDDDVTIAVAKVV